jgi:hypothetical protein
MDAPAALGTFEANFGAVQVLEDEVECLGAYRTVVSLGESRIELLEASGEGDVKRFLDERGEGLFAAGFATEDLDGLYDRLQGKIDDSVRKGEQIFVREPPFGGMRAVISRYREPEEETQGLIKRLYEVTNVVADLQATGEFYARAYGIDPGQYRPIGSETYGYTGKLTMFDPPDRLDRIELTQITDYAGAMGRFHKKHGDSIYMCFGETAEFEPLAERLKSAGSRFAPAGDDPNDVLFIHPTALHGVLMGVSREGFAWKWSSATPDGAASASSST